MGALSASHAWRSFGVLLAEIITGDPPSKRFGLREPMCAHTSAVFVLPPHNTATHQLVSLGLRMLHPVQSLLLVRTDISAAHDRNPALAKPESRG